MIIRVLLKTKLAAVDKMEVEIHVNTFERVVSSWNFSMHDPSSFVHAVGGC